MRGNPHVNPLYRHLLDRQGPLVTFTRQGFGMCLNLITLRAQLRTVAYVGIVSEFWRASKQIAYGDTTHKQDGSSEMSLLGE
jgi:hypothetical protein